jgi:hypothetical protein
LFLAHPSIEEPAEFLPEAAQACCEGRVRVSSSCAEQFDNAEHPSAGDDGKRETGAETALERGSGAGEVLLCGEIR